MIPNEEKRGKKHSSKITSRTFYGVRRRISEGNTETGNRKKHWIDSAELIDQLKYNVLQNKLCANDLFTLYSHKLTRERPKSKTIEIFSRVLYNIARTV